MQHETDTATMPPRRPRGGYRPGAGRKPKVRPEPPRVPDVGDMVLFHERYVTEPVAGWVVRPAICLFVATPGDPESALALSVIKGDRLEQRTGVAYSGEPREGCWSFPEKRETNWKDGCPQE